MHWCIVFIVTCTLTVAVSAIAVTGTIALGPMPIGLALLVTSVALYSMTGLRPLTVAFACATVLTVFVGGMDAARLEVERGMDTLTAALDAIIE